MITRLADVAADREQLLAGAWSFVSRMNRPELLRGAPREELEDAWLSVMASPAVEVIVAEENGAIVAGVGMHYSPFLWNPRMLQAAELFWWADENASATAALRVLREAKARAVRPEFDGNTIVAFRKLTSSPAKTAEIYERMGLIELETTYAGVF